MFIDIPAVLAAAIRLAADAERIVMEIVIRGGLRNPPDRLLPSWAWAWQGCGNESISWAASSRLCQVDRGPRCAWRILYLNKKEADAAF